jgi:tRNA modification GTPase
MNHDTIAAICTPSGVAGIGIIRISGHQALQIASALFRGHGQQSQATGTAGLDSRKVYVGRIVDPQNGRVLDEVILLVMRSPQSYTCEDVVEIQAHSGYYNLKKILELVLRLGARLANPGEFTLRAFVNGRIDLTQAEAVVDLIHAKGEAALTAANNQLLGALGQDIEKIRQAMVAQLAHFEASLDFPEDVPENGDPQEAERYLEYHCVTPLKKLLQTYSESVIFTQGFQIGIVGKPNVGKSTLFNRMIRKDRAIVTSIAGTTRDVVEDEIRIDGVAVRFADTAGICDSINEIEQIGISKTRKIISDCQLILWVVDLSTNLEKDDFTVFKAVEKRPAVLVCNKTDMVGGRRKLISEIADRFDCVYVSALTGDGLEDLFDRIRQQVRGCLESAGEVDCLPNMRHKTCLESALMSVETVRQGCREKAPLDLICMDLKSGLDSLGAITGVVTSEDVLNQIFSRFCIGK